MPADTAPALAEVVNAVQESTKPTPSSRFAAAAKKALSQSRGEAPLSARSEQLKRPYVVRERDVLFEVTGQTPQGLSELANSLNRFGESFGEQISDSSTGKLILSENHRDAAGNAVAKAFANAGNALKRDPVTRKVYVAATVQVRIPLTELQPSRVAPPGLHLGSDRTTAADESVVSALPSSHGWTALIGRGAPTVTGPLVGGRSTTRIQAELDAIRQDGEPTGRGVVLVGDDHTVAGQRLSAANKGYVLVQTQPMSRHDGLTDPTVDQKHQYQRAMSDKTSWALYNNGKLVKPMPGTNLADAMSDAMTIAGEAPPSAPLSPVSPGTPVSGTGKWLDSSNPFGTTPGGSKQPGGSTSTDGTQPDGGKKPGGMKDGGKKPGGRKPASGRPADGTQPGGSRRPGGNRRPPNMTAHDVPGDGNCLITAVADSARSQGVTLPGVHTTGGAHQTMRSMRAAGAQDVAANPGRYSSSLPSIGLLIAGDLSLNQVSALLGGTRPTPGGLTETDVRNEVAARIDRGDAATLRQLPRISSFARQPMMALVRQSLNDNGVLPQPVHLLEQAMRRSDLWNSAIGDHMAPALARALNVNIVVHNPTYTYEMMPNRPDLPVVHINRLDEENHFQSLRPSDSAGGVVGPDQSSWVSVGSPAPVA
ncbi:OTU domain-containing protein, partial [Catenuloplanes japonicus]|uniref:OTU domain-containing protein n=1 Tax=Catenuloplanes japonicus TaxID=33876 RepID=UPI0005265E89